MPKVQNNFAIGTLNKDSELRFVPNGQMIDAENFIVNTAEGSSVGVGRNIPGNLKKSDLNFAGAKTIGKATDPANNKVYNFIKATAYDYIIEHDTVSETSTIVLQSTTGTRLNFIEGERILNTDVITDPEGNGNLLAFSGDSNPPRIINIERSKLWGLDGFTQEEIMLIKAPPVFSPTITAIQSLTTPESNNLEDRFVSFAYRYRYKDGYYSAVSSWSRYFFVPGNFNLDFETFENLGMLNIFNTARLGFNTGPREVERVDLVFKLSNSSTIYLIDKFKKSEEGWADNTTQTLLFNNSKVYSILPESEYFRSFDNVPEAVLAQTTAGNRMMYANFLEGKDLIDSEGNPVEIDFTLDLVSTPVSNRVLPITINSRDYAFGGTPITIARGQMDINFNGISFTEGSFLFINFNIKSNVQEIEFTRQFTYILEEDYTSLSDFYTNSGFLTFLESFSEYFENNGGVTLPDGAIGYEVQQEFTASVVGANTLRFLFPVIKYEIDNAPDPNTFVYDYFADVITTANFQIIGVNTSLKSRRSYEICMIYRDLQCRKTTALTSRNNTIFIPNSNAVDQNQIKVTIPASQKPPAWADTYKFGIKINKGIYQQIFASIFYIDGTYRWVKLDGENKGKVKEGDILTVKKDSRGFVEQVIKIKVLELKTQPNDFIEGNSDGEGIQITEREGLYMKIQPTGVDFDYNENEFQQYGPAVSVTSPLRIPLLVPNSDGDYVFLPINQGSVIQIEIGLGNIPNSPDAIYQQTFVVQNDYLSFEDWFNAEAGSPLIAQTGYEFIISFADREVNGHTQRDFVISKSQPVGLVMAGAINVRSVDGYFIFETEPIEVDNALFYETPEIYRVIDGEHQFSEHLLTQTYNCFSFGNGAESYQIRDALTEKYLSIDFCPTAVSEDNYGQVNRYADITYSGVYNSNTNINKLNEFNLSLANFKDDIEKGYGPIMKIKGQDTNLEVYQEDKDSVVYYGKDLLLNADGSSNLSVIEDVLGQQKTYEGEFGISYHPDSFDDYGFNSYHTDTKRGVVIKKSNNGLFEISKQGMRNYFKKLFRDNKINHINGKYDQFHDVYILNIQYNDTEYVTWLYSDIYNGWFTRETFNPEDMVRINGEFYSFKNGEIYRHNSEGADGQNYNTFYGVRTPSKFTFNFSQNPSEVKRFQTLEIEGTDKWQVFVISDQDKGYVNINDFLKKESFFYAYLRNENPVEDTSLLNFQGVGECTVQGNTLSFGFNLDSIFSIGDQIRNSELELVGIIINKTENSFILDSVNNISTGQFVLCAKPSSIENSGILGYHMAVTLEIDKASKTEIYAVNSEIDKSFP